MVAQMRPRHTTVEQCRSSWRSSLSAVAIVALVESPAGPLLAATGSGREPVDVGGAASIRTSMRSHDQACIRGLSRHTRLSVHTERDELIWQKSG